MGTRAAVAGTTPAAGQGGAGRASRHRAQWVAVWVLVALTAAGYSVFALARHHTYRVVFSRDGYLVLHRSGAPQAAG